MAHRTDIRAFQTTTGTGTGAKALTSTPDGMRAVSSLPGIAIGGDTMLGLTQSIDANGNVTTEWEFGLYTYTAANEVTPTTVYFSSNANAAVNFSAGKTVHGVDLGGRLPDAGADHGDPERLQPDRPVDGQDGAAVLRSARSITGPAGGWDTRELWVINASTNADGDLIFRAENTGSTAANRILSDNDIVLEPGETLLLRYESAAARWRPIGGRRKVHRQHLPPHAVHLDWLLRRDRSRYRRSLLCDLGRVAAVQRHAEQGGWHGQPSGNPAVLVEHDDEQRRLLPHGCRHLPDRRRRDHGVRLPPAGPDHR